MFISIKNDPVGDFGPKIALDMFSFYMYMLICSILCVLKKGESFLDGKKICLQPLAHMCWLQSKTDEHW